MFQIVIEVTISCQLASLDLSALAFLEVCYLIENNGYGQIYLQRVLRQVSSGSRQ